MNNSPDLGPLVVVLARQRELAHNTAAEQEARAMQLEVQVGQLRKIVDELTAKLATATMPAATPAVNAAEA